MSNLRVWAELYQARGLHPIPVEPRGKRPLFPWEEFCERQPTLDEIRAWWTAWPDANVALVMGRGMVVVDVDGPAGEVALAVSGVELPPTAEVKTGNGRHLYYLAKDVPNAVGVLEKVDVRSDRGYVVAPPSVHSSGVEYTWERGLDALAAAPLSLLERLRNPRSPAPAAAGTDWITVGLAGVEEGRRNDTCTKLAGYFLGKGVPERAVEELLQLWAASACTPPFPPSEVTSTVRSIAQREGEHEGPIEPTPLVAALETAMRTIEHPPRANQTPFLGLNMLTSGGLQPGDLIYLGARPGMGKTAIALQWARATAGDGRGTLLASREMTVTALVRRMLAQESQVKLAHLKSGDLSAPERALLGNAVARLAPIPLWLTNDVVRIDQLWEAVEAQPAGTFGLVIVDYLQLVRAPVEIRDRRAGIEFVSQELKRLAITHKCPVLCLSSLSRPPKDASAKWRPQLSDLRESGELEHDADLVLFMHGDLNAPAEADRLARELIVAKNRDGAVGTLHLKMDYCLRFVEMR